jgi:hypothetical protein
MQTYSHFIITAFIDRKLRTATASNAAGASGLAAATRRWPPLRSGAFLLGSIAPDLPLIALTLVCMGMDFFAGNRWDSSGAADVSYTGYLFDTLFFHNPWVKLAHNLFHAPLLLAIYAGTGVWAWRRKRRWGAALFWFALACAIHTAIDIPVHYDDGPLIFFPLNWHFRFAGPISYWDAARGGAQFTLFEHALMLAALIYLALDSWRRRGRRTAAAPNETD